MQTVPPQPPSLRQSLLNRRMLICVFTGFSSGLPLYILVSLLPAWMRSEQVDLKAIGLFALVQFPFNWKFVWSPLMDRYALPALGRRRGWMLLTQILLLASIPAFGLLQPRLDMWTIAYLATIVAFFSASQDIVLDAYRREILPDLELGLGTSVHVNAYRIAGLIPGSLSLILADHLPWQSVFAVTALFMLPGVAMTLLVEEPQSSRIGPKTLREAVVNPFSEFVTRAGWKQAGLVLAFIFLYKLGDSMCTALATPFYLDMGFSKTEIGLIAKNAGLWPSIIGAMIGGLWMVRIGINKALWLFGALQMASILGFALLTEFPRDLVALTAVISVEALGVGLGTAAFSAYIARATTPLYTATQFALFSSLAAVPRVAINATTGWIVEQTGWLDFFFLCFVLAARECYCFLKWRPGTQTKDKSRPKPRRRAAATA